MEFRVRDWMVRGQGGLRRIREFRVVRVMGLDGKEG